MPYDWSIAYDSPTPYDVGNPQSVSVIGIPTVTAFGTITITLGNANIQLTGIGTAAAFGILNATNPSNVNLSGLTTAEGFGTLKVITPQVVQLNAVPSGETFGQLSTGQVLMTAIPRLVQSKANMTTVGNSGQIAFTAQNITLGNFIIVAACILFPTNITGVTDSAGNVYVQAITNIDSGSSCVTIWGAPITVGAGTKPTISIHTTATHSVFNFAWEFTGINGNNPLDATANSSGSGSTGTSASSGPLTTTFRNDVLVGICLGQSTLTAETPGWTAIQGFANPNLQAEVFVASLPSTYDASFTQTTPSEFNAAIASFQPAVLLPSFMTRVL